MTSINVKKSDASLLSTTSANRLFWVSFGFLLTAMVFLGTALWVQSGGLDTQPSNGYPLGTTARFDRSTVVLTNFATNKGAGMFTAPSGSEYAVVTMRVTNTSKNTIMVLPSLDTYLKDTTGKLYYLSPSSLSSPFRSGPLLSGDTIQGQLSYLVPKNNQLSFYIDSTWSGGVAKFALTH